MTPWVLVARLVRPQGRKGEIIADIFTDFPERFATQPRVFLGTGLSDLGTDLSGGDAKHAPAPREAFIERHWLHQGRIVFKFQGIDSINDANTLRGLEVVVRSTDRVPLDEDAVYIGDLIGCRVIDLELPEQVEVGEVTDVERGLGGAPDLLVIRPAHRPVVPAIVPPETTDASTDVASVRPRRGKRAKKPAELLIPFAKKYLVSVDTAHKRIEMRLPPGLTELNADEAPSATDEEG